MSREQSKIKQAEILSPAGSYDALRAAINAGADAVYMGGMKFGARAFAENGDTETILRALDFVHMRGKKLYMTVNTLFKQNEIDEELVSYLTPYYENGLDAVIVQDFGAMKVIHENFPGLQIHASTQASIMTAEGAEGLRKYYGITRFVPGRELSISELTHMRNNTDLEIEVFIHGALCYCYSGQCLLSSMIGGRSGNRGRCAQPCRKLYSTMAEKGRNTGYFLSPRDMSTVEILSDILDSGIDSLKIEGRMKSPEYVGNVTESYRYLLNFYNERGSVAYKLHADKGDFDEIKSRLASVYNRGGFNTGYFLDYNGLQMMSVDRPNHFGVKVGEVTEIVSPGRNQSVKHDKKPDRSHERARNTAVSGNFVSIRLLSDIEPGDVLELRSDNRTVNAEYTIPKDKKQPSGSVLRIPVSDTGGICKGCPVFRIRNSAILSEMDEKYLKKDSTVAVDISFTASKGRRAVLNMVLCSDPAYNVTILSEGFVEGAVNAPATTESVRKQLGKLGKTSFSLNTCTIDITDDIFLPNDLLNCLRQKAADQLEKLILNQQRRNIVSEMPENGLISAGTGKSSISIVSPIATENRASMASENTSVSEEVIKGTFVSVYTIPQLDAVLEVKSAMATSVSVICLQLTSFNLSIENVSDLANRCLDAGISLYLGLPYVCRLETMKKLKVYLELLAILPERPGLMIRNNEELRILRDLKSDGIVYNYVFDYNMYHMNSYASEYLGGVFTIPVELNRPEISRLLNDTTIPAGMILYGYQPVMISAQCVYKNTNNNRCRSLNKRSGEQGLFFAELTDETGHTMKALQLCEFCTNIIFNSDALDIRDDIPESILEQFSFVRYDFTFENEEEIAEVLKGRKIAGISYTHGHIKRGVD